MGRRFFGFIIIWLVVRLGFSDKDETKLTTYYYRGCGNMEDFGQVRLVLRGSTKTVGTPANRALYSAKLRSCWNAQERVRPFNCLLLHISPSLPTAMFLTPRSTRGTPWPRRGEVRELVCFDDFAHGSDGHLGAESEAFSDASVEDFLEGYLVGESLLVVGCVAPVCVRT